MSKIPIDTTAKVDYAKVDEAEVGHLITSVSEYLGNKDTVSKYKVSNVTVSDKLALKDTMSKFKVVNRTITETIGYLDTILKHKAIYKIFSEKVGMLDKAKFIIYGVYHSKKYHDNPSQQITSEE